MKVGTRIALWAGATAVIGVGVLALVLVSTQRREALQEAVLAAESIAEAIELSLEHTRRENPAEFMDRVVQSVGRHPQVEGVRLMDKLGVVVRSSLPGEAGQTLDKAADACIACHAGPIPEQETGEAERSRVFTDDHGHTVVGAIRVIRNRPGCEATGCHADAAIQPILGVLDVMLPLEEQQARIRAATLRALATSGVVVALLVAVLFLIVRRKVQRPIQQLIEATRKVAGGDLTAGPGKDAERSSTEIGFLATAFKEMVESLARDQARVGDWTNRLEVELARKAEDLHTAQLEVAQAEKLSSVGTVAAGIAHELNSPLMAILTYAHLLQESEDPESQEHEDLQTIIQETQRCAGIIRQLLDFSRGQAATAEVEAVDVVEVLDRVHRLLAVELNNHDITLERWGVPGPLYVEANRPHLMQVFVNLVMNALHAMDEGGHLEIGVEVVDPLLEPDVPDLSGEAGGVVRVSVRDDGSGISPDALHRVFDPFFTTKPVGQGSGLGLSVSLGLVQQFGGTILADSDGQSWTEFQVLLRESAGSPGIPAAPADREAEVP